MKAEDDSRLIQECLRRTPGSWEAFVERFAGLFLHVVRHSAQSRSAILQPADIEDLQADIFVAILEDNFAVLKRFRGESSLATFLAVIARRIAVRQIMTRRFAEELGHIKASQSSGELAAYAVEDSPFVEIQRIEDRELVRRMVNEMAGPEAAIVKLFHLEGQTYREIALQTGVPENTIGSTLTRAREKLRQQLAAAL